jgi:hypothetical protein
MSMALSGQVFANAIPPSPATIIHAQSISLTSSPNSIISSTVVGPAKKVRRLVVDNHVEANVAETYTTKINVKREAKSSNYNLLAKTSMAWPLMPGESLEDVAQKLYPQDERLQASFLAKTLLYATKQQLQIKASDIFKTPQLIEVPTQVALGVRSLPIKQSTTHSTSIHAMIIPLQLSYQISDVAKKTPMSLGEKMQTQFHSQFTLMKQWVQSSAAGVSTTIEALTMRHLDWRKAAAESSESTLVQPQKQTDSANVSKPVSIKKLLKIDVAQDFLANIQLDLAKLVVIAGLLLTALWLIHQHKKVKRQLDVSGIYQPSNSTHALIELPKNDDDPMKNAHNPLAKAQQLVTANQLSKAAQLLKTQIEAEPEASLLQRLYLLRLLRDLSWEDDFEKYANQLHQFYNVVTPLMSQELFDLETPTSLEAFPHILEQLQLDWPNSAAGEYIQDLLVDNRGGDRFGFSEEVLEEMALLLEIRVLRAQPI